MQTLTVRLNGLNQIEVSFGDVSRAGECYYLGLNSGVTNPAVSVREGVAQLLGQWLRLLEEMPDGTQLFLPFDFSDESTKWLAVQRTGDELTLVSGWAAVEGWAINPEDFTEFAQGVPGFVPDQPLDPQSFYRPRVLCDLRRSVASFRSECSS